ncbi:MAG: Uma2 family endonuclease [Bacteroidota bacterium]
MSGEVLVESSQIAGGKAETKAAKKTAVWKRLFTVEEYHAMGEAGILHEDDPIELINGEIIEMSPIGTLHFSCVNRLNRLLNKIVDEDAIVSPQNPVRLNNMTEPEPDITVLKNREDEYKEALPTGEDVLLLIEVADSTLRYDQKIKLPLYAASGVPEVWIVNLNKDKIFVYTDPQDGEYQSKQTFEGEAMITASVISQIQLSPEQILGL